MRGLGCPSLAFSFGVQLACRYLRLVPHLAFERAKWRIHYRAKLPTEELGQRRWESCGGYFTMIAKSVSE